MTAAGSTERPPLKSVRIERRGGFAGLHAAVDLDYAALTSTQRRALDKVVEASEARTLAANERSAPTGPDRFSYRIQLTQADGQQRAIDVTDDDFPSVLDRLVKPGLP